LTPQRIIIFRLSTWLAVYGLFALTFNERGGSTYVMPQDTVSTRISLVR
jgi:hypothetical protein